MRAFLAVADHYFNGFFGENMIEYRNHIEDSRQQPCPRLNKKYLRNEIIFLFRFTPAGPRSGTNVGSNKFLISSEEKAFECVNVRWRSDLIPML